MQDYAIRVQALGIGKRILGYKVQIKWHSVCALLSCVSATTASALVSIYV